jgi:splicing factor 3B subunit 2
MAAAAKPSKNQLRRAKKKAEKHQKDKVRSFLAATLSDTNIVQGSDAASTDVAVKDETPAPNPEAAPQTPAKTNGKRIKSENDSPNGDPLMDPLIVDEENPLFDMYKDIMGRFEEADKEDPSLKEPEKPEVYYDDDDDIPDEEEENSAPKISKKKRKEMTKLSVAELKAIVKKPEMVEWTDTSAPDPRLLVHMKSYRNVVPVPTHWSLKREYLSSKRGIEKPPFALPKFIQETGIAEMRDAVLEKQAEATLKQRQRERVQGKTGKLDIDYQKLYDAFFKFQTKPELTRYGEVYYEGKEFETNLRHLRPGELSDELKEALNMPPGAPPPWLINMQRYGPPPSYPALKVPGVNAPPPPGASWGFAPGQWGKPPVDEATNRPLYGGDIFGVLQQQQNTQQGEPIEKELWGELQQQEESEEEDEEEDEDEDEEDGGAGIETSTGLETPSGMTSAVPTEIGGTETVSEFDLRKRRGTETEVSSHPRSAYQVIPERQTRVEGFFGGDRVYDIKAAQQQGPGHLPVLGQDDSRKRKKPGDVDVSMDPDALAARDGMDKDDLRRAYDQGRRAEQNPNWDFQEDLSEMIASESRKRQKRDEERRSKR